MISRFIASGEGKGRQVSWKIRNFQDEPPVFRALPAVGSLQAKIHNLLAWRQKREICILVKDKSNAVILGKFFRLYSDVLMYVTVDGHVL